MKNEDFAAYLRSAGVALSHGETSYRTKCPKCGHGDGSFSLSRNNDGLLYHCFRASCGIAGFIPSFTNSIFVREGSERKVRSFSYATRIANDEELEFLATRFHFPSPKTQLSDVLSSPEIGRLIYPIIGHRGFEIGLVARYYADLAIGNNAFKTKSKALIYPLNDSEPLAHWEINFQTEKVIVVVEDWVSARKIAVSGGNAVALLGVHLGEDLVYLLRDYCICIALDRDATLKAQLLAKKYSLCVDIKSFALKKDFKDQTIEETTTCLDIIRSLW